ncbi:MAG: hypothetical protein D6736_22110 [Nitrospinota bacterium]|nr:MAG: hypothetical protein D6736_22110 [Nitrospinota bacterium]
MPWKIGKKEERYRGQHLEAGEAKNKSWTLITIGVLLVFFMGMLGSVTVARAAEECDYYASPDGSGNGLSPSTPFTIRDFWPVARPGDTLCLLDGTYRGENSMITPPQGLHGTPDRPITIRALNDGKVTIDGERVRRPVRLYYNDYFILEGFNAHSSNASVVELSRSNHNIVRRVVAWDAADKNTNIFGIHGGKYNLLEDCAGWGVARKIFSASQGGDHTTIRRCWGRWEGSHVTGPKMTYTLAYNSYYMLVENSIGTWNGAKMKESYTLLGYDGKPWLRNGEEVHYTNYAVDHPYGIFAVDQMSPGKDRNAHARLLGSIAYVLAGDRYAPFRVIGMSQMESVEMQDVVAYVDPSQRGKSPFALGTINGGGARDLSLSHAIGISTKSSSFHSDWQVSNYMEGSTIGEVIGTGESIFDSSHGVNLCYRYQDGVLTNEPLWPWPMNQRIIEAMVASGREPVDVTRTIEQLFGPIPDRCRKDTAASLRPTPPPDFQIRQASSLP